MTTKNVILIVVILLVSSLLAIRGQARLQVAAGLPGHGTQAGSSAAKQGKAEFLERCSFCHGPDALGASGPDLARSSLVRRDIDGNLIAPVIRNGRPDKGMPAFQLGDAQIANIVAFLHAQAKKELFSFGLPKAYTFRVGDAKSGKAFFFGPGHCSSCHSPDGDLKGVGSKYSPITLMGLIAYPEDSAAPTVKVTTESGRVVSGQLVHLDEFTVSVRDRAGWVQSWDREDVKVKVHDPLAEHRRLLQEYTDQELHNLLAYLESLK